MSVDISSKLMLVPVNKKKLFERLHDVAENEGMQVWQVIEDFELEYASPWYDANQDSLDIGVELFSPAIEDITNLHSDWHIDLKCAEEKLSALIGSDEQLVLRSFQHVW
jgi:hypothetical protein